MYLDEIWANARAGIENMWMEHDREQLVVQKMAFVSQLVKRVR